MFRENIDAIALFKITFLSNLNLDDDPTENDTNEKTNREKKLVNAFKQPVSKLHAMFIQSVIPIFNSFTTFLEAEKPLIHIFYHSTLRLCVCIAHYFQDLPYLKLSQNHMMC